MKIYVGCSLTHAPDDYKTNVEAMKDGLRAEHEILDFVGLVAGTTEEVFRHDTWCVSTADLFIAECSYPSIGLGYELGLALTLDKHILVLAHEDAKVTRLVLGITHPKCTIARYRDWNDIPAHIANKLATIPPATVAA